MARKYLITGDPTIPATIDGWNPYRAAVKPPSPNEIIERAHRALISEVNGQYLNLLKGRVDSETVHGKIVIDQTKLAEMLAEKVVEMGFEPLGNLSIYYKGLNSMLGHRYPELSRAKRRKAAQVLIEHVGGGNPGHEPAPPAEPAE
jgi:hypothetical protein